MNRSNFFFGVAAAFLILTGCNKTKDAIMVEVDFEEERLLVTLPVGWGSKNAIKNDKLSSQDVTNNGEKIYSVVCDFESKHLEIKKTSYDKDGPEITVKFISNKDRSQ